VSTIDIPDMRTGIKKGADGAIIGESDSDTEYDDEDDVKDTPKVEEKKEGKS